MPSKNFFLLDYCLFVCLCSGILEPFLEVMGRALKIRARTKAGSEPIKIASFLLGPSQKVKLESFKNGWAQSRVHSNIIFWVYCQNKWIHSPLWIHYIIYISCRSNRPSLYKLFESSNKKEMKIQFITTVLNSFQLIFLYWVESSKLLNDFGKHSPILSFLYFLRITKKLGI